MQKRSEFDFFTLCRRFAILFDSCTDLLLIVIIRKKGYFSLILFFMPSFTASPCFKGPRKRGNIVAEKLLRKHCFLSAQTGKHLLKKQNVSEKSQKHYLFLGSKKCFRNKCFLSAQTGKHLGKQQCFRNNVSSFAGALTRILERGSSVREGEWGGGGEGRGEGEGRGKGNTPRNSRSECAARLFKS